MKIVLATSYKIENETGTAYVSNELANALSRKNDVLLLCLGDKYTFINVSKNLKLLKIPSIDIGKLTLPIITPDVVIKVFKYLNKFSPDIVHAQNSILNSSLVQTWTLNNKVPLVVTFHHIPTQSIEHIIPKLSKTRFVKLVQEFYVNTNLKKFLKYTDGVIALNKTVEDSIRQIDKKVRIKIINNGLNLNDLLKIKINNINSSKRIDFIFLGSYTERKNQEYLIKIFSYLPNNYYLTCYGKKENSEEYLRKLYKLSNKLKVKNVKLEDYTNNLVAVFEKSDFFVTASLKEAQSLAIIQALAAGKPVIGIENETTLEIINGKNGLIIPKKTSPKKFAQKIVELISKNNYKRLSRESRKTSKKFKIEKVVLKIEKFYKSISNSHS
jgi:glycosyltransferase involved in cell wall biosynthesis